MSRLLIREYLAEIDPLRAASGSGISEAFKALDRGHAALPFCCCVSSA
jgi:hypothetical protein